jgi:hypothetical protein
VRVYEHLSDVCIATVKHGSEYKLATTGTMQISIISSVQAFYHLPYISMSATHCSHVQTISVARDYVRK